LQGSRRTLVLRSVGAALVASVVLPATALAGVLTPESPASPNAEDSQTAYIVMGIVALLFAVAVIAGLLGAVRGRKRAEPGRRTRGTTGVQRRVGASLAVLALAAFVFGVIVTESAREVEATGSDGLQTAQLNIEPPVGDNQPLEIRVSGQQWLWRYEYPDGTFSYYEMVVPVDTAVVLDLESIDVLHRWWVPALGGMFDAVPGADNQTWFKSTETGEFEGASTQFSGPAYPSMRALVRVVEPAEYEAWLEQQAAEIQEAQQAVKRRIDEGTVPGGVEIGGEE
jgi:cytochrome c oxidase subunit 2